MMSEGEPIAEREKKNKLEEKINNSCVIISTLLNK